MILFRSNYRIYNNRLFCRGGQANWVSGRHDKNYEKLWLFYADIRFGHKPSLEDYNIRRQKMPATIAAKKSLSLAGIKTKAKALGIKPGNMKKPELIHAIQIAEGYTPCFGRSNGQCSNTDCCFIKDCLKVRA